MILTDDDGPQRPLDSNTRTTAKTRFDVKVFFVHPKKTLFYLLFFSIEKLTRLFLLKEFQPSHDREMTTRHDLNDLITCFRYYDVFVQTRIRMTTRSSFLERPGNFSGPKTNLKINTC